MCTSHCLKSMFMLCPPGGAFFSLLFYTILGMKLYSYQETNRWYRLAHLGICPTLNFLLIPPQKNISCYSFLLLSFLEKDQNGPASQKHHNEHLTFRGNSCFISL